MLKPMTDDNKRRRQNNPSNDSWNLVAIDKNGLQVIKINVQFLIVHLQNLSSFMKMLEDNLIRRLDVICLPNIQ